MESFHKKSIELLEFEAGAAHCASTNSLECCV